VKGASLFDVYDILLLHHTFTLFARNPNYISMMNFSSRSRLVLRAKRPTARPSSSKPSFAEQETMIRQPSTQLSTAIGKLLCKSIILTSMTPPRLKAAIFALTQISFKPTSHGRWKNKSFLWTCCGLQDQRSARPFYLSSCTQATGIPTYYGGRIRFPCFGHPATVF
jgi:hypothetical protein